MILYLGASSLIKLYIEEVYSDVVREWAEQAEIIATCRVSFTEVISAIDIRFRNNDMSKKDYELVTKGFSEDWGNFSTVDFDEFETGHLIRKYGLRRLDAMHLSAAKLIKYSRGDIHLYFSSAKSELCRAAVAEGLRVLTFQADACK